MNRTIIFPCRMLRLLWTGILGWMLLIPKVGIAQSQARAEDLVTGYIYSDQAGKFRVGADEHVIAWSGGNAGPYYTLTAFGTRLVYLDSYDRDLNRIWRSAPLSVGDCYRTGQMHADFVYLSGNRILARISGCDQAILYWMRLPDGIMLSFSSFSAGEVTVWPVNALSPMETTAWETQLRSLWKNNLLAGNRVTIPEKYDFHIAKEWTPIELRDAIDQARALYRSHQKRADAANTFTPLLSHIDWRNAGLDTAQLNDAAYFLSLDGHCDDRAEAANMLDEVLRRDPARAIAHLNLGDIYYAGTDNAVCVRPHVESAPWYEHIAMLLAQEQYRLYCTAMNPVQIPRATAARLSKALGALKLDDEACHPHYGLFRAIDTRDTNAFQQALADPAIDVNERNPQGITALSAALKARESTFARLLIDHGADPNKANDLQPGLSWLKDSPLRQAISTYDVETVKDMLKANVNTDYLAPFTLAADLTSSRSTPAQRTAQMEILHALLAAHPGLVDQVNDDGQNALYHAVWPSRNKDLVLFLVHAGVAVNKPDKSGETPIFQVVLLNGHPAIEMLDELLALGANPNQQNSSGETVLMKIRQDDPQIQTAMTRMLLDHGADPNLVAADHDRSTALDNAVFTENLDAIQLLLTHGAHSAPPINGKDTLLKRVQRQINEASPDRVAKLKQIEALLLAADKEHPQK